MAKQKTIPLIDIVHKFDVRTAIDDDRVVQFAVLYESGEKLPPIKVTPLEDGKYAYVDGRHRGMARQFLNLPDIEAIILDYEEISDLYADALRSNWGGAKPPTRQDILHTITRMMESGATQKSVIEKLNFLPAGSCRAYIEQAKGNIHQRRLRGAVNAVADGVTVQEAAQKFRLNPEQLKERIAGKKSKWGGDRNEDEQFSNDLKAYISKELRSSNSGISKKMTFMLQKVEDGEMSATAASGVVSAWYEHLRKTMLRVNDWLSRIDALSKGEKSVMQEEK